MQLGHGPANLGQPRLVKLKVRCLLEHERIVKVAAES